MPGTLFFAGVSLIACAGALPLSLSSSNSTAAVPTKVDVVHTEITELSLIVPRTAEVNFTTQQAVVHTEITAASLDVPIKAAMTAHTEMTAVSLDVPMKAVQTAHTEMTAASLNVPKRAVQTAHTEITAASMDVPMKAVQTARTEITAVSLDVPMKAAKTAQPELTAATLDIPKRAVPTLHELDGPHIKTSDGPRAAQTPAPVTPRQLETDDDEAVEEEYGPQPTVSPLPKQGWFKLRLGPF